MINQRGVTLVFTAFYYFTLCATEFHRSPLSKSRALQR